MLAQSRQLQASLVGARAETDRLFGLISPEALYSRPVTERHRLIFYLGHLDAFDWNLLARRTMDAPAFHTQFDRLFERGIDPLPGQAPADSAADWPQRTEIENYNRQAREWIDKHLDELDPWVLQMAVEHRQMHAETLAYLFHNLPYEWKRGPLPVVGAGPTVANGMVRVAAGIAEMGQANGFGWDNEFPAHSVSVNGFGISRFKVSNREYLEFVRQGGEAPNFWASEGGQWFWRGMFGRVPLPLNWPVWVTWRQADAFAKWRGAALPTESQWLRASSLATPDPARDNYDFRHWDPVAVNASAATAGTPQQMTGNGWEWTRDVFAPFEGFTPHPLYPGYSADFFDGDHYVLKGASPRTADLPARPSFRNWFRPEYSYMYAGFRLVEPV
jgi:iron(II)-dependent oxidoreductase